MKKMVIGAFILLIIGIIGTVSTLYFVKGSIFNLTEWEDNKTISGEGLKQIEIDSSAVDVMVEKTGDQNVQIALKGKESVRKKGEYKLKVNEENGKLKIKIKQKINWGMTFYSSVKLYVKIPEKMYESLDVKTSSGELTIKDFQAKKALIHASSGDINVENGNVQEDLSIEATSGSINADSNQANNLLLKTTSGDILNENGKATNNLSIHVSSGEIDLTNNVADKVIMKSTSGDMDIRNLQAKESEFEVSSGSIDVDDISGTVMATGQSGDIEISPNEQVGNMNVETTSGEIQINTKQHSIPFAIDFNGGSGGGNVSTTGVTYTEKSEHQIIGKIGSGAIQLKVRTSSGDFQLR